MPGEVVIFGGSGFIGRNLLEKLRGHVSEIIAVGHHTGLLMPEGLRIVPWQALDDLKVGSDAVVVHLAAHRYDAVRFREAQSEILTNNVAIASRVYEFCRERGITEVRLASSIAVYGAACNELDDQISLDWTQDPYASELMYGWSKRIAEKYAQLYEQQYGIHTLAFRLSNPYGPHDSLDPERAHVVPALILKALAEGDALELKGNPHAVRDFIYVEDVCNVLVTSLRVRKTSEVYNLATGENTSILDLAHLILKCAGKRKEIKVSGGSSSEVVSRSVRNDKLRQDFGLRGFTRLEDGLKRTIEWYVGAAE